MPNVNDQALAAYQEENEDAQDCAYAATQKDRNVFALTIAAKVSLRQSALVLKCVISPQKIPGGTT